MRRITTLLLAFTFVAGAFAASAPQAASDRVPKKKKASTAQASISEQLGEMKQAIESERRQVEQLSQDVQNRDQRIQQLEERLARSEAAATEAQNKADAATAQSAQQAQTVTALKTDVSDLQTNATNVALSLQDTQKNIKDTLESPMALHYKGVTITPGGFLAAETVWRQHALGADINTPFNAIPFDGASQSNLSEFFGSGRQSRISMLVEGKLDKAKLTGYFETDFLSAATTSNNNESNSYSLRQRQAWGQAALDNGWSFTGGQMWSLVTETRKGMDNRTEATPLTIDPQYNVGFSWARQYGFRVTKNFSNKTWIGLSLENPQSTLGGHGASNNFLLGAQGASSGLYNPTTNYSFNATPDFIAKAAFEPGIGHYEVFGVVSDFRDRIFPCFAATTTTPCVNGSTNPAAGAHNNSSIGSGVGANARVSTLNKHLDWGLHFLGGHGIGRYGTAGLPDLVARPDGVLVPVKNYQGLATVEAHGKRLDVYLNFGGEYASRTDFLSNATPSVGYGSPVFDDSGCSKETPPAVTSNPVTTTSGTTVNVPIVGSAGAPLTGGYNPGGLSKCSGDTKSIFESTAGFWYRFYKGPKGTLQWGPQYSHIIRNAWSDKNGLNPQANENMFLTSFRYYLP